MPQDPNQTVHIGKAARLLFADLGLDPMAMLRKAGLPLGTLDGEGSKISVQAFFDLWRVVEEDTNNPHLALTLGNAEALEYFDPAFFAAMCSRNMNQAAARLSAFKDHVGPFRLDVATRPDATTITFKSKARVEVPATLALTELVFLLSFARRATRHPVTAAAVSLSQTLPDATAYADHFGCPVTLGKTATITFTAEDATRPFLTHDDAMWQFFEPQLRQRMDAADASLSVKDRVRHALTEALPSGRANMEEVARDLAMSKRTLQRRLAEEGTTFLEVLNDTRERLAKHYLTGTDLGTAEVSFLLGFEDPNSMFRAFRRWEGISPELWRTRQNVPSKASH